MRHVFKAVISLVTFTTFFSCEHTLVEKPYSTITSSGFFKDSSDAAQAITGIYSGLHAFSWDAYMMQAIVQPGMYSVSRIPTRQAFNTYQIDYTNAILTGVWKSHYSVINACNMALKYIPAITMGAASKNELLAEARWIRAYLYFNLVRLFGDVPMKITPTEASSDVYVARSAIADIYDSVIIPDLTFAQQNLSIVGKAGRIGRGAASFLLGKVYLTMAGLPLNDASKLPLAEKALEDVINNRSLYGYGLMPGYADVFPVSSDHTQFSGSKELNQELIFVIQESSSNANMGSSIAFSMGPQQSLWTAVTNGGQNLMGYMDSLYYKYDSTDERRDINLAYRYASGKTPGTYIVWKGTNAVYNQPTSGMCQNKYIDPPQNTCCNGDPDIIIYRLADAYLMLAEVENDLNGPVAASFDNIDIIRSRAHATLLDRSLAWTQQALQDTIFMERIKELNFEFHDIFDLRRLGKVKETFAVNLLARKATYDPKFELYPIPVVELDLNPLCTQNKGW